MVTAIVHNANAAHPPFALFSHCLPSQPLYFSYPCVSCTDDISGDLQVIMAPKAVSQREETELQAMLERLAREQEGEEEEGPDEPDD